LRALSSSFRKQLEAAVLVGRRASESASRVAIEGLGVFADRRPEHLDVEQAALRNGLRAKWRQLGGDRELLVDACAYEQWHRLLFARFLAENQLLLHPQYRAPVTLEDCEELADELGEPDGWSVAARFAAEILPGIFRLDDPCVRLRLAPEGRHALEQVVAALPADVFLADDALGWIYQFWQKDKKDEVNASERKIGGADLGSVTQLFTENYIVRFLLENSLGAWWASRHPESPLVKGFDYLRFDEHGKPAAGSFDSWPEHVAEVTVMDPCCGSGHFLVEAFSMLWQMRAEEEGLDPVAAQDAVLRDNLFGLELDLRCVQIAMFAVALQAWKAGGKWRQLPVPNIACSGIRVKAPVDEWTKLADGDQRLETALMRLHVLFRDADTLGSLIDPKRAVETTEPTGMQSSFADVDWDDMAQLLEKALTGEDSDPATAVLGADVTSAARAAQYLAGTYCLVTTNVPYLKRAKQVPLLREFCGTFYPDGQNDLATSFLLRMRELATGAVAAVTPQHWLQAISYLAMRTALLRLAGWCAVAKLGDQAFGYSGTWELRIALIVLTPQPEGKDAGFIVDVVGQKGPTANAQALRSLVVEPFRQRAQIANPDSRILAGMHGASTLLAEYADAYQGTSTGDNVRFTRFFWELPLVATPWTYWQSTFSATADVGGREQVVLWDGDEGAGTAGAAVRGRSAWGRRGVVVSQMGSLPAAQYSGDYFDNNVAAVIPKDESFLPAVAYFVMSGEFASAVRRIDSALKVMNATLVKVPFDVERWRQVAEQAGPLADLWSYDTTQWLFEGRPEASATPPQVAVGRLVGYRWPGQPETDDLDPFADADGIACIPSVAGEPQAAERLQQLLATAFGEVWSPAKVTHFLEQAGSKKKNLVEWLRDEFFKQHCALFRNRPFVWHIWDGQREGFSALLNYHQLDRKTLEKLTYTYLGQDWVERQRAGARDDVAGAEARLSAALELQRKLEAILTGEKPYDIYVRWKELHEQSIGWEPDLNDGVRPNIRPFVEAGVLRAPFNIHWKKDRGKNPDGSERRNDIHLSLAEKLEIRTRAGRA
jgi:hypothetical protein